MKCKSNYRMCSSSLARARKAGDATECDACDGEECAVMVVADERSKCVCSEFGCPTLWECMWCHAVFHQGEFDDEYFAPELSNSPDATQSEPL